MTHDASGHDAAQIPSPIDGRYRVLSRLGSGGMADVYLAEDETLGRMVAVKVLKLEMASDAEFVERFRIEARAAARLNHPAIVAVYDRGGADARPYIAMEYVDGESLKQRIRRDGRMSAGEAVTTILAVLDALQVAHEHDIVHRDITSSNVLLATGGRVKVADFGIARIGSSALTRSGVMMGTSSYLSPEQAQGRPADERSDVYSAGVVLFEMLTGRLPFRGESDIAVAMQHVSAAPPNPRSLAPGVPEHTAAAVMRALSKDPADRFHSAAEFAAALRRAEVAAGAAAVAGGAGGAVAGAAAASLPGAAAKSLPAPVSPRDPAGVSAGDHAAPTVFDPSPPTVVAADALTAPAATRLAAPGAAVPAAGRPAQARRRTWLWIAALLVLLSIVAGGWAVYAYIVNAGPRVPHLVGDARPHAIAAVREQSLKPVVHQGWVDGVAVGTVARQRPSAGKKVAKGARVDLWVSAGPLHIPSPTLTGLNATDAATVLAQQSLGGHRRRAATRKVPVGKIYRQSPEPGTTIARGDTVTYWVSTGPPIRAVPDVVGLSEGDAKAALEADGFTVNSDLVVGLGSVPGDVVAQDPVAGTRLRKGDEVVIKVAVF